MRVLLLCSENLWQHNMDRTIFHVMEAIKRHPNIDAYMNGPGFPEWSGIHNAIARYAPDVIFCVNPLDIPDYENIKTTKIFTCNEVNDKVIDQIVKSNTDIVICHLVNDMSKIILSNRPNIKVFNIPHCIENTIFKDYYQKKEYDIMLVGIFSRGIYPLRDRLYQLLMSGTLNPYKVKILKHPGYKIANVNEQVVNYAREINKAKIVLTCSSIYKYALSKYMEVPACNSLLVADIPHDRSEIFRKYVVEIDMSWNNEKIIDVLKYWVSNDSARIERSKIGMDLINAEYTQERYVNQFYAIMKNCLDR